MVTENTTAIINIAPLSDITIKTLAEEAQKVKSFALARVIAKEEDLKPATDDLTTMARMKKAITEKRDEYIKPIKAHLDAVKAAFDVILTPVTEADAITRKQLLAYRQEQARIKAEADTINALKDEAARREAAMNDGVITGDTTHIEAPAPVAKVRTETGTAGVFMVRKWEVIDLKAVPDDYKIIDSARVTKVVKAGIPSIPGIWIYTEESLRVTTSK